MWEREAKGRTLVIAPGVVRGSACRYNCTFSSLSTFRVARRYYSNLRSPSMHAVDIERVKLYSRTLRVDVGRFSAMTTLTITASGPQIIHKITENFLPRPQLGAQYCDERVRVFSVCLSTSKFQKISVQISPNILCVLPVAVSRFTPSLAALR